MIRIHDFPLDSKMILYLDCWTIHRSKEFREWIQATYPFIILFLVPANCTGIFQPCDIGLQRLFKHSVKQSASEFIIQYVHKEHSSRVALGKIRLPIKLFELRDQTPTCCVKEVDFLNSPPNSNMQGAIIEASLWKNCCAGPWTLSYDSITSTSALDEWFNLPPKYRTKIEGDQPLPAEVLTGEPGLALEEDKKEAEEGDDDEDVPAELAKSVFVSKKLPILSPGYLVSEGRLASNKKWDKTAELQSESEEESDNL